MSTRRRLVVENDKATILWDFTIHTDRTIRANRPDIVVRDKKRESVSATRCISP